MECHTGDTADPDIEEHASATSDEAPTAESTEPTCQEHCSVRHTPLGQPLSVEQRVSQIESCLDRQHRGRLSRLRAPPRPSFSLGPRAPMRRSTGVVGRTYRGSARGARFGRTIGSTSFGSRRSSRTYAKFSFGRRTYRPMAYRPRSRYARRY